MTTEKTSSATEPARGHEDPAATTGPGLFDRAVRLRQWAANIMTDLRRPSRGPVSLCGLLMLGLTPLPGFAQGGYQPLRPIESRAGDTGTIDSAAIVDYNEYSGNVSVDLSVNIEGLSLPIRYNSELSAASNYYPGPTAEPWHFGYGILSATTPQPLDDTQTTVNAPPTNYQKVFLREAGGVESEFVPDYFFQNAPEGDGWYNYHYVDRHLRRIERTIDVANPAAHTAGNYILLNRDGSRVRYEPRDDSGIFYPVEVTRSNGRKIFLNYRDFAGGFPASTRTGKSSSSPDPVLAASATPLLESVSDEWGRSLVLHYELRPTGTRVVSRVSLTAPGQSVQDLAEFSYTEILNGTELETRLRSKSTPEGHVVSFDYAPWQHLIGAPIQRVTLPTGGAVELSYILLSRAICPYQFLNHHDPDVELEGEWLTRVETLSFAGQHYTYSYETGQSVSNAHDGSWVVRRTSFSSNQAQNHERLTQYHHEETRWREDLTYLCHPRPFPQDKARLAGQPIRRLISVGGPQGSIIETPTGNFTFLPGGHHHRREWAYNLIKIHDPNHVALLRSDVFLQMPVVLEYSEKRDAGVWGTRSDRELVDGFMVSPTSFDQPTQISQWRTDDPAHRQITSLVHESRVFIDHDVTTSILGHPHVIGLTSERKEFREILGQLHLNGHTELTYTAGHHPQMARRLVHTGPNAMEEETMTYYGSGHPWHGLLNYRERSSQGTSFDRHLRTTINEYQFGKASSIQPPTGPAIEREYRGDGSLVSEIKNGAHTAYDYDDDSRLIRRRFPGSQQNDEIIELSDPGAPPTRTVRVGSRLLSQESFDPWGRLYSSEQWHDDTTSGVRTTSYDDLGRIASETNASGARRFYTYDALGRQRSIITHHGSAQGPLLERVDIYFRALPGGKNLTRSTLYGVQNGALTSDRTVREMETDLFGRSLRAATIKDGETHQTTMAYKFVDGFEHQRVQPEGGTDLEAAHPARLSATDWLGRKIMECQPEHGCQVAPGGFEPLDPSRAVSFIYDDLGRLVFSQGPGAEESRYSYDALDRLIARFDDDGTGDMVMTARLQYDPSNNQLISSESFAGDKAVATSIGDFDALQRPREMALTVPSPLAAPYELSPHRYWLFGPELTLRFEEAGQVDRYVIELQRLGGVLPTGVDAAAILSFETQDPEFVLTEAGIQAAVADLGGKPAATVYLTDLAADPDFLLDPAEDKSYRWRVYGWKGDEPTLASAWQPLDRPIGPDDCYFDHFRVRDGVGEGALLEWSTRNCSETGPLSVRMMTTVEHPEAACALDDVLFATDKNGPRRALFMVTGWDMVDGAPAIPTDPNAPQCAPVDEASFRGVIEDSEGVEVHAVGPATGYVLPGGVCDVRNINVIDGLGGTAPVVRWETQDCEEQTVEVLAEVLLPLDHPDRVACRPVGVIASGPSGQTVADFMLDGYTGLGGVACGPVDEAWFRVRTTAADGSTFESTPVLGFVEPEGGFEGCYTRLFTESSVPGIIPIIAWETRGCEGYDVEITRTSVGVPQDLRCLIRNELWDTSSFGARDARFMVEGYEGADGAWCDPVAELPGSGRDRVEFDFFLNLRDPETNAFVEPQDRIRKNLRATYSPTPASGSPHGPCRIDFFSARNGFHGTAPFANWGTSGDCQDVRLRVYTDPALEPAACRLNGEVWSHEPNGPWGLHFMVGGYDFGLDDNYDGVIDCRGEPGGNGTYGEALRFAYLVLEAEGPSGTVRAPETGSLPVRNHNDQIQTDLPGPNDPCTILDFYVHQAQGIGQQPTDSTPVVHWRTNCPAESRYSVQVLANTHSVDQNPFCAIHGMAFSGDKNGPKAARFLRTGWWDFVFGQQVCEGRSATFSMRIVDTQTNEVLPGEVRDPITVFYSGPISGDPPIDACAGDSCTSLTCENPTPTFAGLQTTPTAGADCRATLTWSPGQSNCDNPLTYRVYRGTHAGTFQSPSFLWATDIADTSFTDPSIVPGSAYYYVVSAVDTGTGVESEPTPPVRLQNGCVGGGGVPPFRVVPDTIDFGQSVTLTWDIPEALGALIVGIGDFPAAGTFQITPTATTTYQAFAGMADGTMASFTATVTVNGAQGPEPEPGGTCDRPCSDSVVMNGEEYFCRGFGAWDGDYQVEQSPVWLAVSEWPDYVLDNFGEPISPYCLKAVCGSGSPPPNRWHVPSNEPASWLSDTNVLESPELDGDDMDNNCNTLIDEIGN